MATKRTARRFDGPVTEADKAFGFRIGCDGYESTAVVAARVGVSERTVQRWLIAGLIRYVKLDDDKRGGVRVCIRSVNEYLASRERTATV